MTKYRAIKTECANGHVHDSKLEAGRCDELHALQASGALTRLELQPKFPVYINGKKICDYVADFAWFTADCRIIEDVKGVKTRVFSMKKRMVEAYHPGTVITIWPPRKRKARKRRAA